jgi:hypothetical protein
LRIRSALLAVTAAAVTLGVASPAVAATSQPSRVIAGGYRATPIAVPLSSPQIQLQSKSSTATLSVTVALNNSCLISPKMTVTRLATTTVRVTTSAVHRPGIVCADQVRNVKLTAKVASTTRKVVGSKGRPIPTRITLPIVRR